MFKCSQCHTYKSSAAYGMQQRSSKHGPKGSRLLICLSCATTLANRKWKHIENNTGHPEKRVATEHPMLPSDFVAALAKHASTTEINDSWCVSVDDTTLTDKEIANNLASLAWKATGYRFRWAASSTFILQCTAHPDSFTQLPYFKHSG